ncbi:transposase [Arthrobacter sp. BF1]|uniref:transposase n=1 Tax=Arthrobacter sp. BF1 TaxID=2821145 RepID=UPI001C4F1542|nr:transposase [Arthrobacter sp. BF1]
MAASKSGVSTLKLQRTLGIGSYQTVSTMLHRFRLSMGAGVKERLSGAAKAEETFFGGPSLGSTGRGALGKVMVLIAVEHTEGKTFGRARMRIVPVASTASLAGLLAASVTPGLVVRKWR